METAGMTQGSQAEVSQCDLEMEGPCVEDPELRDETESMDDDQDGEVEVHLLLQCQRFSQWQRYCLFHVCVPNLYSPHSLLLSSSK